MRRPDETGLGPEPWDPVHSTPPKFLRLHASRSAQRRRVRRAVLWLVAAVVGFGFLLAEGGLLSILRRRSQIRALERDVQRLEAQHRALYREVELRRDDPATIERLAREEYGMIYKGEKVVRIVEVSETEARRVEAAQGRWLGDLAKPPAAAAEAGTDSSLAHRTTSRRE